MKTDNLKSRGQVVMGLIAVIFAIFAIRLYSIQVISNEYEGQAKLYSLKTKVIVPPRGNIYNRNGELYVTNNAMFDMMVTPKELSIPDTSLLSELLGIEIEELRPTINKALREAPSRDLFLARYIDPRTYSVLQEKTWNFTGVNFSATNKRYYHYPVGANFLGYISEVNKNDIEASDGYYVMGNLMGKSGIEKSFEHTLRGQKGTMEVLKDNLGREVGSYADGKYDVPARKGANLMLGIDTDLQQLGEELMRNKRGSIVAIEPSTGEILAFVSAPTYDPGQLTGSELARNWRHLSRDSLKPLFNRPLMATYPPGSIFKVAVALAALNEGIISEQTTYSCGGGFKRNRGKPGCRAHPHPLPLSGGVQWSCNSYFSAVYMDFLNDGKFRDIYHAYEVWHNYMDQLGLGHTLGIDVPYEKSGLIPRASLYDKIYGKNRWGATNIISNAIGQGEILMTPLQMANLIAIIANRGHYIQPHFVKAAKYDSTASWQKIPFKKRNTTINERHFGVIADAMEQVVANGTGRRAFIEDISVCGKTGTVENPHGEDHATFIAFAPKENPRIAIAVIIENSGGGGGRWAAPTAAVMIERYINGRIVSKLSEYERVRDANFIGKNRDL